MKNIILAFVIVGAAAFGFIYLKKSKESAPSSSEELNARATTAEVETKDIDFVVTVAGEITPAEQVSVRPEVNGMIEQLPVDVGDKVKEGDLLFSLDDKNIQIEIEQKQTQIDAANLQLEKAKRNFERDRKLFEEKLVSREAFQNTETEFMGTKISSPICVTSTAFQRMATPDGEVATARACNVTKTPLVLSSWATSSNEDVGAAAPDSLKVYQIYMSKIMDVNKDIWKRVKGAGFKALALTCDTQLLGKRLENERVGFSLPPHLKMQNFAKYTGEETKLKGG